MVVDAVCCLEEEAAAAAGEAETSGFPKRNDIVGGVARSGDSCSQVVYGIWGVRGQGQKRLGTKQAD